MLSSFRRSDKISGIFSKTHTRHTRTHTHTHTFSQFQNTQGCVDSSEREVTEVWNLFKLVHRIRAGTSPIPQTSQWFSCGQFLYSCRCLKHSSGGHQAQRKYRQKIIAVVKIVGLRVISSEHSWSYIQKLWKEQVILKTISWIQSKKKKKLASGPSSYWMKMKPRPFLFTAQGCERAMSKQLRSINVHYASACFLQLFLSELGLGGLSICPSTWVCIFTPCISCLGNMKQCLLCNTIRETQHRPASTENQRQQS